MINPQPKYIHISKLLHTHIYIPWLNFLNIWSIAFQYRNNSFNTNTYLPFNLPLTDYNRAYNHLYTIHSYILLSSSSPFHILNVYNTLNNIIHNFITHLYVNLKLPIWVRVTKLFYSGATELQIKIREFYLKLDSYIFLP